MQTSDNGLNLIKSFEGAAVLPLIEMRLVSGQLGGGIPEASFRDRPLPKKKQMNCCSPI